mmetsp:Transcript_86679/g.241224  ORF Transcript_86679/g.241224 Transcript_86679/m.241224 type:complete len:223 (-) Transcript_86679:27-695(-)
MGARNGPRIVRGWQVGGPLRAPWRGERPPPGPAARPHLLDFFFPEPVIVMFFLGTMPVRLYRKERPLPAFDVLPPPPLSFSFSRLASIFSLNLLGFMVFLTTFFLPTGALAEAPPGVSPRASSTRAWPPRPPSCRARPRKRLASCTWAVSFGEAYTTSVLSKYFVPFTTGEPSCSKGTPVSPWGNTVALPATGFTGLASRQPSSPGRGTKKDVQPPSKSSFK